MSFPTLLEDSTRARLLLKASLCSRIPHTSVQVGVAAAKLVCFSVLVDQGHLMISDYS